MRGTAMLPRAGFPELGDSDLAAAVDYMISTLGLPVAGVAAVDNHLISADLFEHD